MTLDWIHSDKKQKQYVLGPYNHCRSNASYFGAVMSSTYSNGEWLKRPLKQNERVKGIFWGGGQNELHSSLHSSCSLFSSRKVEDVMYV